MKHFAYYNEVDPFCAEWLAKLIVAGQVAPGLVDTRSIEDVQPYDLRGFTQCHFFAGIGVWSYALRRAGWADDAPAWTGSCPCQPFSAAGRRGGAADERHLWPAWHHLIQQCGPAIVLGEQVASKDGRAWFDTVQTDLEGVGYAAAAFDLSAAGFGAPHIRQRLYFAAERYADGDLFDQLGYGGAAQRLADSQRTGLEGQPGHEYRGKEPGWVITDEIGSVASQGDIERLADGSGERCEGERVHVLPGEQRESGTQAAGGGPTNGAWRSADWLHCRDGKWRPVEPGTFPLADGIASRVGRLRAYGNSIVAPQAQAFIEAVMGKEGKR